MLSAFFRDAQARLALIREGRKQAGEVGPGLAASLLLHGFAALVVLFFMLRAAETPQPKEAPFIPIDVVRLGDSTASPPAEKKARVPLAKALPGPRQEEQSPVKPEGYSPRGTKAPVDALDRQLRSLAHLRQPKTDLHITPDVGPSNESASSDDAAAGDEATYSVRDYVRAQVERRWNLDLETLGARTFTVAIHIEMKRDGTITRADIVDRERFTTDAAYHSVALSARNAVLLSSPINLPPGSYKQALNFTLSLDPRDTLR